MDDIPAELTRFINTSIDSVDQLRILLLLYRSPDKEWDALSVAPTLYLKPDTAAAALAQLEVRGLLAVSASGRLYHYQPKTPELAALVAQVAQLDQERPVTLINLVYARPKDSLQAFSDAFKLGRKEE